MRTSDDLRIKHLKELLSPAAVMAEYPLSAAALECVLTARQAASDILHGRDDRLLVIVGPCSIHDTDAALDYATRLVKHVKLHAKELHIIMRVYFEKPRTTVGWKGLINDPYLNQSFDINEGLRRARKLLTDIAALGLSAAVEFLDTITPQYFSDAVAWGAIGARTTESQVHRELASGLSMPIGFKNGTNGDVQIALDAVHASKSAHHFLSVTKSGQTAIVSTLGNEDTHIILRGSHTDTNYDEQSIIKIAKLLDRAKLIPKVMVDCSHGNSQKDHTRQALVVHSIAKQIASGSYLVMGVMIESHLHAGKQALTPGVPLKYGVSITDACLSFEETEILLTQLAEAVRARRQLTSDHDALAGYRHKIDEIDKTIESLILERARQAQEIAQIKKSQKEEVMLYRPEREQAVIRKVIERNMGPVSDQHMEDIFRQIMTACLEVEK